MLPDLTHKAISCSNDKNPSPLRRSQTDVPLHSLEKALKIPQAIMDNYGKRLLALLCGAMRRGGQGFQFFLGEGAVGAVHRRCLGERGAGLRNALQIQQREAQAVLIARVGEWVGLEQRRGGAQGFDRLRIALTVYVNHSERRQRQALLNRNLLLPLLVSDSFGLVRRGKQVERLLRIALRLVQLLAFFAEVVREEQQHTEVVRVARQNFRGSVKHLGVVLRQLVSGGC